MGVVIHAAPSIAWQGQYAAAFKAGLANIGIDSSISASRHRESDTAILLGTTLWREIEATGDYLLVDRASIGNPRYAQLVWNGHGRRGDHKVPADMGRRAQQIFAKVQLLPWVTTGYRVILCGQTETYSPTYTDLGAWYDLVRTQVQVTHFRQHPAGANPTGLPRVKNWDNCAVAITLNSSVAVDALINGIPTVTMDEGSLAWSASGHWPKIQHITNRQTWLEWLAWTQWHYDEITDGKPIKHLFEAI